MATSSKVILHPTDFSEDSDRAFQLACCVARSQSASLIVVHVLPRENGPGGGIDPAFINEDAPIVRNCRASFRRMRDNAGDLPVTFRIVSGNAVGAILKVAYEEHAALIVIAPQPRCSFQLELHGSVAEGLLRQSPCPVICLRQPHSPSETPSAFIANAKVDLQSRHTVTMHE